MQRIGSTALILWAGYIGAAILVSWWQFRNQHNELKEQQERMNIRSEAYQRKMQIENMEIEVEEEEQK